MKKFLISLVSISLFFMLSGVSAQELPVLSGSANVQDMGWISADEGNNHLLLGTQGLAKRMEAFTITTNYPGLSITYQSHVQDEGWQNPVENGQISGTEGQGKRVEAFRVNLQGEAAPLFHLYYRTHVETYGWLDWTIGGPTAGTTNHAFRCEALELLIVPNNVGAPGSEKVPAVEACTREEAVHMTQVNMLRQSRGLSFVTGDPNLRAVACQRVMELPIRYSHVRPDGTPYQTAVKTVFPNYRNPAGGFVENFIFGGGTNFMDPILSFRCFCAYPHLVNIMLEESTKYMSWASVHAGSMSYAIQTFSGLDRIDFAD